MDNERPPKRPAFSSPSRQDADLELPSQLIVTPSEWWSLATDIDLPRSALQA